MARVIIVDDEYFVRMGIKSIVNRKEKEHMVVAEAENGTGAVPVILEMNPDIVFLDITMPGMDGIQVLEHIRQRGYKGYVAMLTCHEDFSLIQKAMRLGADDYVLKNELVGESMLHYLDEISGKLAVGHQETGENEVAVKEKREETHFYKVNFLKNILQIGGMSKEEFVRGCARYGVRIRAEGIYMITIYMKHWDQIVNRYKDSDLQVFFSAVDSMMEENFKGYREWEGFYLDPFCYHILFTCSQEKSPLSAEEKIRDIVNKIRYHFERILDIDAVISVFQNTYPAEELHKGYQQAQQLMDQRFFWPEKKVFWNGILHAYEKADLEQLERMIREEASPENPLSEVLKQYISRHKDWLIPKSAFLDRVADAVAALAKQYGLVNVPETDTCEDVQSMLFGIRKFESELLKEEENSSYSYLVKQALQIMNKDFTKKITLEEVAEQLGISAGYFSRIFSAETGETFSNYVINKRIEYAKELIMTTNYKFYEIAGMCGFSSSVHFNNTFKKICEVTPNQYRKEH